MHNLSQRNNIRDYVTFIFIPAVPTMVWGSNYLLICWFSITFQWTILRSWLCKHKLRQTYLNLSRSHFSYLDNEDFVFL